MFWHLRRMYSGVWRGVARVGSGAVHVCQLHTTRSNLCVHSGMSQWLHTFVRHLSVGLPAASHEMSKSYEV